MKIKVKCDVCGKVFDKADSAVRDPACGTGGMLIEAILKAQDGTISEFDDGLWGGRVELVTVGRNKEITVTFRDGTEILA